MLPFNSMKKKEKIFRIAAVLAVTVFSIFILFRWGRGLGFFSEVFLTRAALYALIYLFLVANCLVPWNRLYPYLYRNRVLLSIILFGLLVAGNINFSSVGMWNDSIQPATNVQNGGLIYGTPRAIRSDEWLVNVPRMMAGSYNHYGPYNDIVRGVRADSLSATGYIFDYCALAVPDSWGYYLFGAERGLSFMWCFRMVFGFLTMFELCMIVSGGRGFLSVFGASVLWFSSYNMWWSLQPTMFTASASVVLFYYFVTSKKRWKRTMFGVMTAVEAANFAVVLYPAWQVPFAWTAIFLILWILFDHRQEIKKFRGLDYLSAVLCILFAGSLVLRFLYINKDYMTAVMNTAYPGRRYMYGGYIWGKAYGYLAEILSPMGKIGNPSEVGCFFLAFPLGFVFLIAGLVFSKGKKSLLWFLSGPMMVSLCYCSFELPRFFCHFTLIEYSSPGRMMDVLGYQYVLVIVAAAGSIHGKKLWKLLSLVLSCICVYPALKAGIDYIPDSKRYIFILAVISTALAWLLMAGYFGKVKKLILLLASAALVLNGMMVNPVMKGIGAITSKPVYQEIRKITEDDPEARWIGMNDLLLPNYLIACGARTLNSVNYIPNMELWKEFDPSESDSETYNRYAHIVIDFANDESKTSWKLVQPDYIHLKLSIQDLKKLDVKYIFRRVPIPKKLNDNFSLLYSEDGVYIYQVRSSN